MSLVGYTGAREGNKNSLWEGQEYWRVQLDRGPGGTRDGAGAWEGTMAWEVQE